MPEEKTLNQRLEDLLGDTDRRLLLAERSKIAESPEGQAQIEWLKARRYEIKTIMSFAEEPDEPLRRAAWRRIRGLEADPWDAGGHNKHVKSKKPNL